MSNTVVPPMLNPAGIALLVDAGGAYVTVAVSGMTGAEVAHVYYGLDGFIDSGIELTADLPVVRINGAGIWRVVKDSTAAPSGIYVSNTTGVRLLSATSDREHGLDFDAGHS